MKNIVFHIIGLSGKNKENFKNNLNNTDIQILDIDEFNYKIISSNEINNLYNQYSSLKKNKNEKYKTVQSKMISVWENNLSEYINNSIATKYKYILIGNNFNFNNINKKINIDAIFKINIKPSKKDIRDIIEKNLVKFKNEIINGLYPIENINYTYQLNQKNKIYENYKKTYINFNFDKFNDLVNLYKKNTIPSELFICLKDDYFIGSLIHPNNILYENKIVYGYDNVLLSILETLEFDEIKMEKNTFKIYNKNTLDIDFFDKNCYIYKIEPFNFLPFEKKNNLVFISFNPVKVVEKRQINIKNYLKDLKIL